MVTCMSNCLMKLQALNFWEDFSTLIAREYIRPRQRIPSQIDDGVALVATGKLPQLPTAAAAGGGRSAATFLDDLRPRGFIGPVYDSCVAMNDFPQGAKLAAGGVYWRGMVDS